MTLTEQQRKEFEAVTRPVIEWLNNNCHPHVSAVIEPTRAELLKYGDKKGARYGLPQVRY